MRPRRIEIHVYRERAGPPDADSCEKRPALAEIFSGEGEGKRKAQKSVEGGGEGHGGDVGRRKSVSGNVGAEMVEEQHAHVGHEEEWKPEQRRADGPEIADVSRRGILVRQDVALSVQATHGEALVAVLPVVLEIEPVLDEHGAGVRVVADAVSADPRIA